MRPMRKARSARARRHHLGGIFVSIKNRLLALTLGVILALILITLISYVASRQLVVEQVADLGNETAALADAEATAFLKERLNLLEAALGSTEHIIQSKGFLKDEILKTLQYWGAKSEKLGVTGIYMVMNDGTYLDSTGWEPEADYHPREQQWYTLPMKTGGLTFTDPYIDQEINIGSTILSVANTIKDRDGRALGVMAMDVDLGELSKFVIGRNINGEGHGLVLDARGIVVSHPEKDLVMKLNLTRTSDLVSDSLAGIGREMQQGKSGYGTYTFMGSRNEIFYRPLEGGWSLGIVVPIAKLMAPARALAVKQAAIGVVATLLLGGLLFSVYRSVLRPITRLLSVMSAVREGDMTLASGLENRDELGSVARAVDGVIFDQRNFLLQLREQGIQIDRNTEELDHTFKDAREMARVIADRARELTLVAEENADAVQSVNASIEELSAAATGAANAASGVSNDAEDLRRNAEESEEMLRRNTTKVADMAKSFESVASVVRELDAKASSIDGIVSTITGIADQTNLLALNAAIEAARAGDAGRGFAVVAEEVRKLAEESNSAASRIGELAREIVTETASAVNNASGGVKLASTTEDETRKTQERLSEVILAVSRIVDQIQSVAATSQEQSAALQEMTGSVDRVSLGAVQNKEKSEEIARQVDGITRRIAEVARTADALRGMTATNNEHIARYKLDESPSRGQLKAKN